jgi:hypothetical protein
MPERELVKFVPINDHPEGDSPPAFCISEKGPYYEVESLSLSGQNLGSSIHASLVEALSMCVTLMSHYMNIKYTVEGFEQ